MDLFDSTLDSPVHKTIRKPKKLKVYVVLSFHPGKRKAQINHKKPVNCK